MSTTQFQVLFKKIKNTNFRQAITSIEKLAIYLILACLIISHLNTSLGDYLS